MSHYFERYLLKELDLNNEISKINQLFNGETNYFATFPGHRLSTRDFIDNFCFRRMDLAKNSLSMSELFEDLPDKHEDYTAYFVELCEIILTILLQFGNFTVTFEEDSDWLVSKICEIRKVINYDLEKMNLTPFEVKNELGTVIFIDPKDAKLEKALEIVNDQSIESYLIEYKALKTEGNVKRKEELLKLLCNYVENITKNPSLLSLNNRLYDDTNFLFNNLNLRHGVEVNDKTYYNATLSQREKWLDITFDESIAAIVSKSEAKHHVEIKKLREIKK